MRHVVRHWQGNLSEQDSSAAMQLDDALALAATAPGQPHAPTPKSKHAQHHELCTACHGSHGLACHVWMCVQEAKV